MKKKRLLTRGDLKKAHDALMLSYEDTIPERQLRETLVSIQILYRSAGEKFKDAFCIAVYRNPMVREPISWGHWMTPNELLKTAESWKCPTCGRFAPLTVSDESDIDH